MGAFLNNEYENTDNGGNKYDASLNGVVLKAREKMTVRITPKLNPVPTERRYDAFESGKA